MSRGRIYIAGPIAGMANGNREAFAARAAELIAAGYEPLNPWDISPEGHAGTCLGEEFAHDAQHCYGCHLRADIAEMMFCDGISLLPGWNLSKGATTEHHVAMSIGLSIIGENA